jgi:hypothetical protein
MRAGPTGLTLLEAVEAEAALTPRMLTPRQLKTMAVRKKEVLGGEGEDIRVLTTVLSQREREAVEGGGDHYGSFR